MKKYYVILFLAMCIFVTGCSNQELSNPNENIYDETLFENNNEDALTQDAANDANSTNVEEKHEEPNVPNISNDKNKDNSFNLENSLNGANAPNQPNTLD